LLGVVMRENLKFTKEKLSEFSSDTTGNVAIFFAATVATLLIGIGAAVDYSGMVSKRAKLQDIADSAALAAVTSGYQTEKELESFVSEFVAGAGYPDSQLATELTSENTVIVTAKEKYALFIAGTFGNRDQSIRATAEAPLGGEVRANLALVLDTTGSMSGNRMETLKSASALLLEELEKSNGNGEENVNVSLVPFADYVRISESNEGQNWLQLQPAQEFSWRVLDEENSVNCRQIGEGENIYTECDQTAYKEETNFLEWEGCMGSRASGFHTTPEFDTRRLQGFVAHADCNGQYNALEPLTSDLDAINTSIQSFETRGKTYIPSGLIWGWRTLDESPPFEHDANAGLAQAQKIMLVMTDGSNTAHLSGTKPDFEGIYHWSDSRNPEIARTNADALTSELCSSIKQDGIRIITVAFEIEDTGTKNLLDNCASSSTDYYDASNSDQLKAAFKNIGESLNVVRLIR